MKNLALIGAIAATLLSGCASTDVQNAIDSVNSSIKNVNESIKSAASAANINPGVSSGASSSLFGAGGTSITQTKLMGIYSRSLATSNDTPEWPKVVISNLTVPEDQFKDIRIMLKRGDCVRFDALIWESAKKSEKLNNVTLCATELPKRSNSFVTTWKIFTISGNTSGQVRTDGPTPPTTKLPGDAITDRWLLGVGQHFIGSMLTMMGYDPNFTPDNRRFWVKNVIRG